MRSWASGKRCRGNLKPIWCLYGDKISWQIYYCFKSPVSPILIIFAPVIIISALLYVSWGIILYVTIWLTWKRRFVLFVYSDSPTWKNYIEAEIIPKIQNRAVILNWSERKAWKNSLAVLTFRYFGGDRNFNPLALVFRPFRFAKDYRFYEAFKKYKHGKSEEVEKVLNELFDDTRDWSRIKGLLLVPPL